MQIPKKRLPGDTVDKKELDMDHLDDKNDQPEKQNDQQSKIDQPITGARDIEEDGIAGETKKDDGPKKII